MKLKNDCDRRHLRGCRGCVALGSCASAARRMKLFVLPSQEEAEAFIAARIEPRHA